jgi:thioredoxin-dependent peroxiredoxin
MNMRTGWKALAAAAAILAATPAAAQLTVGARAPDFWTEGATGGRPFRLHLAEQLRDGPLILYFYPRAFTEGCTLEAHAFSEAAPQFRALGARVVGVSADDLDKLTRFSVEACRSAFPVAAATPAMIDGYRVRFRAGAPMANRTSFLIAPDGRILAVHSDLNWQGHVPAMMTALREWRRTHPVRRGRR